jgi:Rad3-related DNA helicase
MGDPSSIPPKGVLETSTIREEIAIERQRQALNAVVYERSVNSGLRGILISPSTAKPPLLKIAISDPGGDFDDDKKAVLAKALGIQDILAVEGPPGTGKTRLIEEIIVQYLNRNPTHRVLISSQTHVALDNVIERVRKRSPQLDIVRVGRFDDPKIASVSAELLLERKAEAWSKRVSAKARQWLESWAQSRGVDPSDLKAGIAALGLSHLLIEEIETRKGLTEPRRGRHRLPQKRPSNLYRALQPEKMKDAANRKPQSTQLRFAPDSMPLQLSKRHFASSSQHSVITSASFRKAKIQMNSPNMPLCFLVIVRLINNASP